MDYILETRNLTKKIKSENIIKGISLKIPKGETYVETVVLLSKVQK